jgi:hypothetical protein
VEQIRRQAIDVQAAHHVALLALIFIAAVAVMVALLLLAR